MNLLYVSTFLFFQDKQGAYFALPANANDFFGKYLDVFSSIKVLGDQPPEHLDKKAFVKITDQRITVKILPSNNSPKDFKNDCRIKRALEEEILDAQAIIIKPSTRKGIFAERIAKKLKKDYMIEVTGDIHNALLKSNSFLKRMYAPFLYWMIRYNIKDCKFGLYVSNNYLQRKYPISGLTCGCSDVVIKDTSISIIKRRIKKINAMDVQKRVDIGLIGFYQSNMKGVDTAIRALSKLPETYHLSILGNGSLANQNNWIDYGLQYGVKNRIHFPEPLLSSNDVMEWLDTMDLFILPTRSEGFPRSVVEALSRGLVTFASNICSLPELLPQECLHEVGDDLSLYRLIKEFSENKKTMKKYAFINFKKSKEYAFDILKEKRNEFLTKYKDYLLKKF